LLRLDDEGELLLQRVHELQHGQRIEPHDRVEALGQRDLLLAHLKREGADERAPDPGLDVVLFRRAHSFVHSSH